MQERNRKIDALKSKVSKLDSRRVETVELQQGEDGPPERQCIRIREGQNAGSKLTRLMIRVGKSGRRGRYLLESAT